MATLAVHARHLFSSAPARAALVIVFGLGAAQAQAATLAVVAPQSGPFAPLGQQIIAGAKAAAVASGQEVALIDESCDEADTRSVADAIVNAGADAAIGFLCSETLAHVLPDLTKAGIPAITVSVRWKSLMEDAVKYGWPFYRLAPAPDDEGEKITQTILSTWADRTIALIDDGTIHSRELVDEVRNKLETGGLKPVFVDTFRPGQENQIAIVRRLQRAGASHVFIGGDRNDVAIIARDAAAENSGLTLIGADSMRAADQPVALPDGVYAIALPDYAQLPEAQPTAERLRAEGIEPEGYLLPAYAAVQIVDAARQRANTKPLAEAIGSGSFDTAIGPIGFGPDHELITNPYRLQEWEGGKFVLVPPPGQ
ncbi:branched-chain amino acid ABC transporter substrate-binding protein [Rhizobium halophytocola]